MRAAWRHRLRRLTLLLFVGVVLAVGVALAADRYRDPMPSTSVGTVEAHGRTWVLSRIRSETFDGVFLDTYGPQRPSAAEDIVRFHQSLDGQNEPATLPWWFSHVPDVAPPVGEDTEFEVANVARGGRGYPFPCLYRGHDRVRFSDGSTRVRAHSVLPVGEGWWSFGVLPMGLALNAVLYGALVGGLWLLPGVLVRARRRERGLCPACGYARAGLPSATPCPECGQPAK